MERSLHQALTEHGLTSRKEWDDQRRSVYTIAGDFVGKFTAAEAWAYIHKLEDEPTWGNHLRKARELPTSELRRHAAVSKENRHRCQDCFCCAALTVIEERARAQKAESEYEPA